MQVILGHDSHIQLMLLGETRSLDCTSNIPKNVAEFEKMLSEIDALQICFGGPSIYKYKNILPECAYKDQNVWRHKKCSIILSNGTICHHCYTLSDTLSRHYVNINKKNIRIRIPGSPTTKGRVKKISYDKRVVTQRLSRKEKKLKELTQELQETHSRLLKMEESTLDKALRNLKKPLPSNQVTY